MLVALFQSLSSANDLRTTSYSFRAAYDLSYLSYTETSSSVRAIDSDTGWLNGGYFEGRYDSSLIFSSLSLSLAGTDSATYLGSTQTLKADGTVSEATPASIKVPEALYLPEADIGIKLYNNGTVSLAPYGGLGYRYWVRGENNSSTGDYEEDYSWYFIKAGLECSVQSGNFLFRVKGALSFPYNMELQTRYGSFDLMTLKLGSIMGYGIEGFADYTLYKSDTFSVSIFISPYFQRWNEGKSDSVNLTRGGSPTGYSPIYEPSSYANVLGYRAGMSITL
jgi:hypothetical protein